MVCPKCGSDQICVKETKGGQATVERKRLCMSCNSFFYTVESVVSGRSDCPELMKAIDKVKARTAQIREEKRRKREKKNV